MRPTFFLALVLSGAARADELVLKDGKRIELLGYRDLGESIEAESTGGVKVEIKKSEIARVDFKSRAAESSEAAKADAVLTGAFFAFDKKIKLASFDLIRSIDPKKDTVRGTWKLVSGALLGDGTNLGGGRSHLETSYIPPPEYDLSVVVERIAGDAPFTFGLVNSEGKQFVYELSLNGWNGPFINGGNLETNKFAVKEDLFPKNKLRRSFQIMIRKYGFAVRVDGKDYVAYKDDWSKLWTPSEEHLATKRNVLYFLVKCTSSYKIHGAVVTFPKE